VSIPVTYGEQGPSRQKKEKKKKSAGEKAKEKFNDQHVRRKRLCGHFLNILWPSIESYGSAQGLGI